MSKITSFFKGSLLNRNASDSFERKLAPHLERLYKQAYQYTGTAADAEDLLQDLLLELYSSPQKMLNIDNLPAWLNRCLYHRYIDRYRKTKRQPPLKSIDDNDFENATTDSNRPDHEYFHQQILSAMQLLNEQQRAIIIQHDINGYTLPELAEMMDIPLGTLKSHLHRGRQQLKKCLNLQPLRQAYRL
jgi:RNA polymerase sigma-70 factor (ECF subfamily)